MAALGAARGGRWLSSRSRSPPSTPAAASPAPRRPAGCPSFPTGSSVPFRFSRGWCAFVSPVGGRGAPRVGIPSPSRRGSRAACAGRSRRRARGRHRVCLVAAAVPPHAFPPPTPVRVPSYRVPARRFKDPRGGRLSVSGVGGTEGPVGGRRCGSAAPSDSRSRGAPPSRGLGAPSWAPVGLASACPVRRCVVGRGAPCLSVPTLSLSCSRLSRWPARGEPLSGPPAASPGAAGGGGTVPPSALSERKNSYDS